MPAGELGEAPARGLREPDRGDHLVVGEGGRQGSDEQLVRRGGAGPSGSGDAYRRAGSDGDHGQFGGRVGVRDAAACGAAGADRGVSDPLGRLGQQRVVSLRGQGAVPGQGSHLDSAAGGVH